MPDDGRPDAAFHDIGKLINWESVGLRGTAENGRPEPDPHEFEKCVRNDWSSPDWLVNSEAVPWQSILTWHPKWHEKYPTSLHRWHLKCADWLIASYGRSIDEKQVTGEPRWGRYCLWTGRESGDPRLTKREELRDMIEQLNASGEWKQVEGRYGDLLARRAETARPGLNVTTLAAHCATVGKLSRVLEEANWEGFDRTSNPTQKAVRAARLPPKLITANLRLSFRQRPFRARDLGVFRQMADRMNEVMQDYADNVLSQFGFECIASFATLESYQSFLCALENAGFLVTARKYETTLKDYLAKPQDGHDEADSPGIMRVVRQASRRSYVNGLPARIDLPICEGCQMAQATKHWPKDHLGQMRGWQERTNHALRKRWREIEAADFDPADRPKLESWLAEWGEEDLCEPCFEIRRNTQPIPILRDGRGDVLYIRLALDMGRLSMAIEHLHKQYLQSLHCKLDKSVLDRLFVSFPLIVDFVRDYSAFLNDIRAGIGQDRSDRVAVLEDSLVAIMLNNDAEVFGLLDLLERSFRETFPKFLELPGDVPNPIGIGLSLSAAKHPFFDHWRFLEDPPSDVSIQCVGSGRAAFRLTDYLEIKEAVQQPKRSQVHRLASAAAISPALGQVTLRERDDRGHLMLDKLSRLVPAKLDLQSARLLANLTGE